MQLLLYVASIYPAWRPHITIIIIYSTITHAHFCSDLFAQSLIGLWLLPMYSAIGMSTMSLYQLYAY